MRVSTRSHRLPSKIPSYLTSNISDFVEDLTSILLRFVDVRHRGPSSGGRSGLIHFKFGIFHGNLVLRKYVQFHQARYLEFIDFNPIGICPKMKANGNQLNDELLNEVQTRSDEERDDNFVNCKLPRPRRFVTIQMMVLHGWEKGDLDGK